MTSPAISQPAAGLPLQVSTTHGPVTISDLRFAWRFCPPHTRELLVFFTLDKDDVALPRYLALPAEEQIDTPLLGKLGAWGLSAQTAQAVVNEAYRRTAAGRDPAFKPFRQPPRFPRPSMN